MPLFGKDAVTYYSTTLKTTLSDAAGKTWIEVGNIQDQNDNFNAEEVDITTRETAQTGWNAVAFTTKNGEITFGILIEPDDAFVQALMAAFLASTPIAVLSMTGSKDESGTFGLAANWSVSMQFTKEVKGVQKADVTLKVFSKPEWVEGST